MEYALAQCGCLVVLELPTVETRQRVERAPCGSPVCPQANADDLPAFSESVPLPVLEGVGA